MTETTTTESSHEDVPALPADAENPALIDAEKTFKIMAASAVIFVLAAVFIIMRTRIGQ